MVRCHCHIDGKNIVTRLTGNATYEWIGHVEWDGERITEVVRTKECTEECSAYDNFVASIK